MTTGRIKFFFEHLEEGVMACLLAVMTGLTFIQVVLRYVFNSGWVWSLEATTYSFAWLVLIGMSYGVRTRAHIAVDLFTGKLPNRLRYYVALLATGICLFYSILMLYGSSVYISKLYDLNNMARDIELPKWVLTGIMPPAFLLLAIRFFQAGREIFESKNADVKPAGEETLYRFIKPRDGDAGK